MHLINSLSGRSANLNIITETSQQAPFRGTLIIETIYSRVSTVAGLMVSSMAATSYTLIGSEAQSSILHNLEPGRLLLAIQVKRHIPPTPTPTLTRHRQQYGVYVCVW